jgi:predicted transcriptional regulator
MSKVLYKKRLCPTECGLEILTEKWIPIKETSDFFMCARDSDIELLRFIKSKDETEYQAATRLKKIKRISKTSGRFAFESEEKAVEHLRFLKSRQLKHLKRETAFIELFLDAESFEVASHNTTLVPNSKELVRRFFVFD